MFTSMVLVDGLIASKPSISVYGGEQNTVGELRDTEIHYLEFIREEEN